MACTCVYANAENTKAVRGGFEQGGYLLKQCDECLLAESKALDDAYADAGNSPAEAYNRDLLALVQAARDIAANPAPMNVDAMLKALEQFEPWLEEQTDDPVANGWVGKDGRP